MRKNVFLLLLFLSVTSIGQTKKDSLLKADIKVLVEELEFMYGYDQTLREYTLYKTFDKSETNRIENLPDSLRQKEMAERQFSSDSLGKQIFGTYINPMDDLHTSRLMEITKKYGFPSLKRIKNYYKSDFQDPEFNPFIILIHAPKRHWEELRTVMKQELAEKRIDRCAYGYLLWHINGRTSFKPMLDNGYEMVKTANGNTSLKPVDCE